MRILYNVSYHLTRKTSWATLTFCILAFATSATVHAEDVWWSHQPVKRPAIPEIAGAEHPIDAFVAARLESQGLTMAPSARRRALMRRVYLGLVGLPPTLDQQEAFLSDSSPQAWEKLVDQLLGSPHYGERWARYWLDLVRYADSNGYERDAEKPYAWKYRDYVIGAFNEDKPYNQFVLEQLAGDELEDSNAETLTAMGYWAIGAWNDEVVPLERPQYRVDELDDLVMTTSQTFLASTLSCARCHDHKFDPFTAVDYYRMVSIFESLERANIGRTDYHLPIGSRAELDAVEVRDRKIRSLQLAAHALWKPHRESYQRDHGEEFDKPFHDIIHAISRTPDERGLTDWDLYRQHSERWNQLVATIVPEKELEEIARIEAKIEALKRETPDLPRGYYLLEDSPRAPKTYFLSRGDPNARGPEMQPGVPAALTRKQPQFLLADRFTTRRRLSFARWVVSPDNPLTARVIVNRIWQHHFGIGLVATPSDFGRAGARPTHPQLLDWLAHWFVHDADGSIKHLHRLILSSRAYRMTTEWNELAGAQDPEDKLLWRFPYRRLEVEAIRDSMLAVSGQLNPGIGGAAARFHIPDIVIDSHSDKQKAWSEDAETERNRRTIYGYVKRSLIVPMIEGLDFCDTIRSTARRANTTVATQSLILFNGEFVNRQAGYFAERLLREAGDHPDEQIDRAYRLALARPPTADEKNVMRRYLSEEPEGLVQLCRVILNLNEFVYVD